MDPLIVEAADGIATVTIDRPPVNALTMAQYTGLTTIFAALGARDDVRCVILRARGTKAFCAGFDFKAFAANPSEDDPASPLALRGMLEAVRTCPLPVIAEVGGPALGAGCVLASVCDIRVASRRATFSIPEIDFGRVGGGAYLARHVFQGTARLMAFTGRPIDAVEAHRTGLVDLLVDADVLEETVRALATTIAAKQATALRHMKRALNQVEFVPVDQGYEIEQMHSMIVRAATRRGGNDA